MIWTPAKPAASRTAIAPCEANSHREFQGLVRLPPPRSVREENSNPSPPEILQDLVRCVVAGGAGDAAARMRARAAHVEPRDGRAVIGMTQHRTRGEDLIERQRAMHDVAAEDPALTIKIERRQRHATQDRRLEA